MGSSTLIQLPIGLDLAAIRVARHVGTGSHCSACKQKAEVLARVSDIVELNVAERCKWTWNKCAAALLELSHCVQGAPFADGILAGVIQESRCSPMHGFFRSGAKSNGPPNGSFSEAQPCPTIVDAC